jgi:hypothetical protein
VLAVGQRLPVVDSLHYVQMGDLSMDPVKWLTL